MGGPCGSPIYLRCEMAIYLFMPILYGLFLMWLLTDTTLLQICTTGGANPLSTFRNAISREGSVITQIWGLLLRASRRSLPRMRISGFSPISDLLCKGFASYLVVQRYNIFRNWQNNFK